MDSDKAIANFGFTTASGTALSTGDFNQKSHLALIYAPGTTDAELIELERQAGERSKTWDWLGLKIFAVKNTTREIEPGVHIIDRFGRYVEILPLSKQVWDQIEKELVYYEARHC